MRISITLPLALSIALAARMAFSEPAEGPVRAANFTERDDAALVRQLARQRGGDPAALAQIVQLTRQLDAASASQCFAELADAHAAVGNLDLAAETRRILAEQFPDTPAGAQSLLWVVRLYASSEVAHARRQPSPGAAAVERQLGPAVEAAQKLGLTRSAASDDAGGEPSARADAAHKSMATYALALAGQAITAQPALADDDALAFQRSVAARRAGQPKIAQGFLTPLKRRRAGDAWGDCARAETWLLESSSDPAPKNTTRSTFAQTPPRLDGVLDEPYWRREDAAPSDATTVCWAHDDEFLYVSIRCTKLDGVDYPHDQRPRPRDGDVEAHDRVRLVIDVDRDYASWFELVVDSRGWTADRCWGDPHWNPAWYVAAGEVDDQLDRAWTIEAAIPLAELSPEPVKSPAAWACAVERLPPRRDALPPTDDANKNLDPAAFQLLLFD